MPASRINHRVVQLHGRTSPNEQPIQKHDLVRGEARLLGTLMRSGKVVDYYRIDDGETISYVYSERTDLKS